MRAPQVILTVALVVSLALNLWDYNRKKSVAGAIGSFVIIAFWFGMLIWGGFYK